jgi:sugar-specific transcriptional regulator TrmB
MKTHHKLQSLVDLGLTEMESEVYAFLVENSPATGYRIAKNLGKPTANTYKALYSLQEKGALIVEEGPSRLYRSVPVDEFLSCMEHRFQILKEKTATELSKLKPAPDDERIYHLQTPDQVYERFKYMLAQCEEIALLDLFPLPVERLKSDIEIASARGVSIIVRLYKTYDLKGAEVVIDPEGERALKRWPGQWANGVFDGKEHLLALFSNDGQAVHQAVWSGSAYISWVYHSALMFEVMYVAALQELKKTGNGEEIQELFNRLYERGRPDALGYRILIQRFGEESRESGEFHSR